MINGAQCGLTLNLKKTWKVLNETRTKQVRKQFKNFNNFGGVKRKRI